jgi:hypothetical protein
MTENITKQYAGGLEGNPVLSVQSGFNAIRYKQVDRELIPA